MLQYQNVVHVAVSDVVQLHYQNVVDAAVEISVRELPSESHEIN
jgi:hypothetical protein